MEDTPLTPEEAKASLGLSTRLSEGLLSARAAMLQPGQTQQESPEAPQDSQEAPTEQLPQETGKVAPPPEPVDLEPLKADLVKELSSVIKDSVKSEIGNMRKEIEKAINDEDTKTKTK